MSVSSKVWAEFLFGKRIYVFPCIWISIYTLDTFCGELMCKLPMFAKQATSKMALSLFRYHIWKPNELYGQKVCKCSANTEYSQWVVHHTFLRKHDLLTAFLTPIYLEPVDGFLCYRLLARMTPLSRSVHCDNAYSYGDNFIHLYLRYDLSMGCHNRDSSKFDSMSWLLLDRLNSPSGVWMGFFVPDLRLNVW